MYRHSLYVKKKVRCKQKIMEAFCNIQVIGDKSPLPGPSDYVPERKFTDKKGVSISPRYYFTNKKPDPALVSLRTTIGQVTKISIGPRVKEPKKDETPGPNYLPPKFGNVTPIHFPRSRRTRKHVESPGPQDYCPQYEGIGLKHVPATIGSGKRPSIFNGDPTTPSAANYNPHYEPTRPRSPRVVIGHKYKEQKKDRTGEFIAARSTLSPRGASFGRSSGRTLIMHV